MIIFLHACVRIMMLITKLMSRRKVFEKLIVAQLFKKFPEFYGHRMFIAVFIRVHN